MSADLTVCAHAVKVGCVISPGREHAGEVVAVDIGIPPEADVDPFPGLDRRGLAAGQDTAHGRAGPQVLGRRPARRRRLPRHDGSSP